MSKPVVKDEALIIALRSGPRPLKLLWRELNPELTYSGYRNRVERQVNAGFVEKAIGYGNVAFLMLPGDWRGELVARN